MSEVGVLEDFETLHRDLLALSESRLLNVERLWIQLEARIADFRRLLDKNSRNEQSRKTLATGMRPLRIIEGEPQSLRIWPGRLQVQDDEYAINGEFQQSALQVA